jgi:uncharacterized tellurite resistance protein B-like protein
MFGKWLGRAAVVRELSGAEHLESTLRAELTQADEETVLVAAAIVGLLGVVAYADGDYSLSEQQHVRSELGRIQGLTPQGIDAVCSTLKRHIREIAAVQTPLCCRVLRELADHELRFQVLQMLMALAASDERLTTAETSSMRHITGALGLTQLDYNEAQEQYKRCLAALS